MTRLFLCVVTLTFAIEGQALAQSGDPGAGREVFEVDCAMCHGADASGMMGVHPSLRGAVERLTLEGVEVTIRNGRDTNPPMPSFEGRLSEEEIDDVVAYLDTLPEGPRNFGPEGDGMMEMDGGMDGGMWSWLLWTAVLLIVLAAVVIGSILAVRGRVSRGGAPGASQDRAMDILKERFARGEIDRDEFEERRRMLKS